MNALKKASWAVSHSGNVLRLDERQFLLDHRIEQAFQLGDKVIVLFDPDSNSAPQRFSNLVAMDLTGHQVWTAELPSAAGADVFYQITSQRPLKASSYTSFSCEVDHKTGRLTSKIFYK